MRKVQRYSVQQLSGISAVARISRVWAFALALFGFFYTASAQSGLCLTIRDASNARPLEGVFVYVPVTGERLPSDREGKACLSRAFRTAQVILEADGYKVLTTQITWSDSEVQLLMTPLTEYLSAVDVSAYRALSTTPVAQTRIEKAELSTLNDGRDIPVVLENVPGVVSYSDAGAGIGYTGLRIRGSDPTRINVTINGVTINDAESQGVFWVNMPDLISSAQSVQIQRGVGTSVNGPGAFGASINIETDQPRRESYAEGILGTGSFNTRRLTAKFGTGLLNDRWVLDGRISRILSNGYIDRATSDLNAWMFNLHWLGEKTSVRFVSFGGHEVTYQAWYGIDSASIGLYGRKFNFAGAKYNDQWEPVDFYRDEVDNYRQQHYQLHVRHAFSDAWSAYFTANYTKGAGYYEQFRQNDRLSRYNLPPMLIGSDTVRRTDLVRRLWLDNDLYVASATLRYEKTGWNVVGGLSYYDYFGDHFGEIIWARYSGVLNPYQRFYFNDARKRDYTAFVRADYQLNNKWFLYTDLQYRLVTYTGQGIDRNQSTIAVNDRLPFLNPKTGLYYKVTKGMDLYGSIAVAHREPARRDYLENTELPKPEQLIDYELGARWQFSGLHIEANAFYMDYYNQLVVTGELTDVGFALRRNVGRSYRRGVEAAATYKIGTLEAFANASLSQHRNIDWKEAINDTIIVSLGNTPIALSAGEIVQAGLTYHLTKGISASVIHRFVGRQYLDNTGNSALSLNPYQVTDARITAQIPAKWCKELSLNLFVNNLFSTLYASNGYVFEGVAYIFPQATRNWLLNVAIRF
ncbi:MAG: TonB-dependent receptor [Thermaurantimonas sp.]|uniref:TonB-dependent receptor n=1 Tax=Thermaurantimonas sp. TaxID=2681568 RepID=UPI00391AE95A